MAEVTRSVNNRIYEHLGDRWYNADDDPVALLRAEARLRNPWVSDCIRDRHGPNATVLDIGCGAGFLSNALARDGYNVVGLDASPASLAVASQYDSTKTVRYTVGDALALPFADASFDAVAAMDLLEHVETPARVAREVARVLRPRGTFFFHTFNRSLLSWLVVIKGVEWFVRNTPRDLHVLRLFVTPDELRMACEDCAMTILGLRGCMPAVWSRAFWKMLLTRRVPRDLRFQFTNSTRLGYAGYAERNDREPHPTQPDEDEVADVPPPPLPI